MQFSHLHCHTQYSLLDGQADIKKLIKKAKADNMPAVAITDHGNMFGVFEFVAEASKQGIKPIVGCEFYVVEDHHKKQFTKEVKDVRYHQLLLAKNATGYKNLSKLCSLGYMEGLYGKYPRVTKALIDQYKEGLIASTCCIGASVPKTILKKGEEAGEIEFKWWLDRFGEDYYVELQRHEIPDQIKANEVLIKFARKYNVKIIASNDSHYVDQDDWVAHDILLCVNTNEKQSTPSMKDFSDDDVMPKNTRFAFFSDQFYFKNTQEMTTLFHDLPEAIDNTNEIVGKVETLKLKRDIMLPNFPIPTEFQQHTDDVLNQWEYLRHLTYEGAKKRYVDILPNVQERIDFELFTIRTMGFAGYFLIVSDFIQAGRDLGVMIGPGRGSAAGSVVAYCTGITNIDPIKYDLLFERFLNPDRKSMPDIDTDFDDEGRQKVIDYVVQKYGKQQVAQIVTYGTMASKSSIKDVARVMDLPLADANAIVKLVPDKPTYNMTLKRIFEDPLDGPGGLSSVVQPDELENVKRMRALAAGDRSAAAAMRIVDHEKVADVLRQARKLEGTVRNTGLHAAGIIIAPSDLSDIVPVSTSKDTTLIITQYEGKVIEDAGVIKMDFLGLRNLTIIKESLRLIKQNHGLTIDIDEIPLDDAKSYELFQRGETNAIFQFESDGMKKHMKDLKPDRFGDLIAMNALYRPGPIAYIPNYINRKHGREEVKYDLPEMEEHLADTYGICVTGDTLVHDALTGKPTRIDQLESRVGDFLVQGVDKDLRPAVAPITYWVCNGVREVLEVRLRNGSRVKLTANHKILTETGWQMAGDLTVGDYVATPRQLAVQQPQEYDWNRLRVLAYLLADGSIAGGSNTDFVSKDDRLVSEYQRCIGSFERLETSIRQQIRDVMRVSVAGVNKAAYHETNSLVSQLREWKLKDNRGGCRSNEKFVPDFVFGLTNKAIAWFLASLWDCDGHIAPKLCHYKTISARLATDVRTLLLRLGIQSTTYETTYQGTRRETLTTAYQVTVYNLKQFQALIAPYLIGKVMNQRVYSGLETRDSVSRSLFTTEVQQAWPGSARSLMATHGFERQHLLPVRQRDPRISRQVVESLIEVLPLPETARNIHLHWDEIVSINPIGEELVYDITVAGIHNFVGNNIILHNCVYQEQLMLLSQKLGNFTKGDADVLRKAMGKKDRATLDKMKGKFMEGTAANKLPAKACEKVWTDWEAFAAYAFNKSHSTCYAFVAYQTAWLKTHYTSEYMAAVLTSCLGTIEKITFFMEECKNLNLSVLGPDVNESERFFGVNKKGEIRFGMGGIKGAGDAAVDAIIEERRAGGPFTDIFEFAIRVNLRTVNKKTFESLAYAGAFDSIDEYHRAQYFEMADTDTSPFLDKIIRYANNYHAEKAAAQQSLFGSLTGGEPMLARPRAPIVPEWNQIEKLKFEKDVVGFYITGHPLDEFKLELDGFCNCTLDQIFETRQPEIKIGGIVSALQTKIAKNGNPFAIFKLEDYGTSMEMALFGDDYVRMGQYVEVGRFLHVTGKTQNRWNSEQLEFKPTNIRLLTEMREKFCKELRVSLTLDVLNAQLVTKINDLVNAHPGTCTLHLHVVDHDERIDISLQSRTLKVAPVNALMRALEAINGVTCKVA